MSHDDGIDEVEDRIREIHAARQRLADVCDKRGLAQVMREGRRLAKREKRLFDYLSFTYTLQGNLDSLHEVQLERDLAVELISLLEDEDKARAFGPNFDADFYEYQRSWMLPLVYKSLADATAELEGYNSPGMHACIAEGISVCRRMNYREGIIYFREFAFEVYQAADDLDMALHFARETITIQTSGSDRKVASADDAARALGLQGRLQEAVEQVLEGWAYCETFHNPYLAKLNFLPLLRETCAAAGRTDLLAEFPQVRWPHELQPGEQGNYLVYAERGTDPSIEAMTDRALAVEAACAGDYDKAIALVEPWATLALKNQVVHPLLENRCRLMVLYRLAGRLHELHEMAKTTEAIARQANDFLTLHTIKLLLDESFAANPLASVGPADCGPFAMQAAIVGNDAPDTPGNQPGAAQEADAEGRDTPLAPLFHAIFERLQAGDEQAQPEAVEQLLGLQPQAIELALDAEQAMHMLNFLVDAAKEKEARAWGEQLVARFPGEAGIVSMLAVLTDTLRGLTTTDEVAPISKDEINQLFRRSLEINSECGRSYARAGAYYLNEGDFGEAERCLARAFRLNRQSATAALGLADVYANTERPRDALAVLDMALREGCDEPRLAWHAAMHADALGQFEVMLTYLNWYAERVPDQNWLCFFRAIALIELKRPEEALEQIALELHRNPDSARMLPLLSALARAQQSNVHDFRAQLEACLAVPLREVDVVSPAELARLMGQLWSAADGLPADDPLRLQLENLLLKACLMPVEYFDAGRIAANQGEAPREVRFYRVVLGQILDDNWSSSPGCLASEGPWQAYNILWCVLAESEEKAVEEVLAWQARCAEKTAEVIGVTPSEEVYNDLPGVVSQGPRAGLVAS